MHPTVDCYRVPWFYLTNILFEEILDERPRLIPIALFFSSDWAFENGLFWHDIKFSISSYPYLI